MWVGGASCGCWVVRGRRRAGCSMSVLHATALCCPLHAWPLLAFPAAAQVFAQQWQQCAPHHRLFPSAPGFFSHSPDAAQASQLASLSSQGPVGPPTCIRGTTANRMSCCAVLDTSVGEAAGPLVASLALALKANLLDVLLHCYGRLVAHGIVAHMDLQAGEQLTGAANFGSALDNPAAHAAQQTRLQRAAEPLSQASCLQGTATTCKALVRVVNASLHTHPLGRAPLLSLDHGAGGVQALLLQLTCGSM